MGRKIKQVVAESVEQVATFESPTLGKVVIERVIPAGEKALMERHPDAWQNVREVTLRQPDQTPLRVVVQCTEQTHNAEDGTPMRCLGLRDIATQDLFQVKRCYAHQQDALKSARRAGAKRRRDAKKAATVAVVE